MKKLVLATIFTAFLTLSAFAATDYIYRLDPASWTLHGMTKSPPTVPAPDGSMVTPFLVGLTLASAYPASGISVNANDFDTFSLLYRNLGGPHPEFHVCINGKAVGYATHQCLTFDGVTGAFSYADPGILTYSIAPINSFNGWYLVIITFKTVAGYEAYPYVQANPEQKFALDHGRFVTGQAAD